MGADEQGGAGPVGQPFDRQLEWLRRQVGQHQQGVAIRRPGEGPQPIIYFVVRGSSYVALYVRTRHDLGSIVKMVEREAEAIGHGTRIRDVTTLDTVIGDTLMSERLLAGIGGVFAFLGLLLAAIGLFGLLNYSVTRRT